LSTKIPEGTDFTPAFTASDKETGGTFGSFIIGQKSKTVEEEEEEEEEEEDEDEEAELVEGDESETGRGNRPMEI
jgi:hypothetical protein